MPIPLPSDPVRAAGGTLADAVFDRLSARILDGTLPEGEVLHERGLEQWLGVSRTPIREALMRLTVLGLVETAPSRYTRVTRVDEDLIRETLEYTGYQAGLAVRMAIPRLTDEQVDAAVSIVDEMVLANDTDDIEALYDSSRRLVGLMAHHSGNRIFNRVMRETGLLMERNLRNHRPLLGQPAERREWYEKLRDGIQQRDGDYAEFAFRRQHQLDIDPSQLNDITEGTPT